MGFPPKWGNRSHRCLPGDYLVQFNWPARRLQNLALRSGDTFRFNKECIMRVVNVLGPVCLLLTSLVSAGASAPTQAQVKPVQPTTTNLYPTPLYQMNDVSKTLNLNKDQINRLNTLTNKIQGQYSTQYGKLNNLDDATRFTRQQELNQQYYRDWNKGATDILNNDQRLRYQQLNHQYGGFNTLYDPDVQKRLNLTPAQMKNLRDSVNWNNQQLQNIRKTWTSDPTKGAQQYNTYWQERQQRFNTLLTPAQQQTWRELTGEPYTFQPNFTPR